MILYYYSRLSLWKERPELMFNNFSERGTIVLKLSPTHCHRFDNNIIRSLENNKN